MRRPKTLVCSYVSKLKHVHISFYHTVENNTDVCEIYIGFSAWYW